MRKEYWCLKEIQSDFNIRKQCGHCGPSQVALVAFCPRPGCWVISQQISLPPLWFIFKTEMNIHVHVSWIVQKPSTWITWQIRSYTSELLQPDSDFSCAGLCARYSSACSRTVKTTSVNYPGNQTISCIPVIQVPSTGHFHNLCNCSSKNISMLGCRSMTQQWKSPKSSAMTFETESLNV